MVVSVLFQKKKSVLFLSESIYPYASAHNVCLKISRIPFRNRVVIFFLSIGDNIIKVVHLFFGVCGSLFRHQSRFLIFHFKLQSGYTYLCEPQNFAFLDILIGQTLKRKKDKDQKSFS